MADLQDLTIPFADLFRSSYNLGFHPAVLVGDTMNLDGQRNVVQTALDYIGYSNAQSVNTNLGPNSVADWNIQNFTFDKGQGGTLVLGGAGNRNGLLQIKDAQGNVIVSGDNLGSHYFDTAAHDLVTIDEVGFHAFDTSGHQLIKVDNIGFHGYDTGGIEHVRVSPTEGLGIYGISGQNLIFRSTAAGPIVGQMGYYAAGNAIQVFSRPGSGTNMTLFGDAEASIVTPNGGIAVNDDGNGRIQISANAGAASLVITAFATAIFGDLDVGGNFSATGTKSSIVKTSQGDKLMYANESPENWFMDFCEEKGQLDPLFLEATSPPYHYIKCDDGEYQVWGKRKGYENVRMESVPEKT